MIERLQNRSNRTSAPELERLLDPTRNNSHERTYINRLLRAYTDPHRHTHTFERAAQKAAFIEKHTVDNNSDDRRTRVRRATVVRWAALYSDAVYDPNLPCEENKSQSAAAAVKDLSMWFYDSDANLMTRLMCGTHEDLATCNDPELPLFLDADLLVMGSGAAEYRQYAANLRLERSALSDSEYSRIRSGELIDLFQRDQIFLTDAAHATLENQARTNILHELENMDIW